METGASWYDESQVRGVVILAFVESLRHMRLLPEVDIQEVTRDVEAEGWYPIAEWQLIFDMLVHHVTMPEPLLERVGMGFIDTLNTFPSWQHLFQYGLDFLNAFQDSRLYHEFVQGDSRHIGEFALASLDASQGKAIIRSTTPFSKALERGILLRGLQCSQTFDYVEVDRSHNHQVFHIEFLSASSTSEGPYTNLTAKDFLAAQELDAKQSLSGAELQKVFWRVKELENALKQQQVFWEASYHPYARDVIERQQMERALRESEQRFRSLIDVHPVPLGIVNRKTMSFLFVNAELARLVNCSSQELLDMYPESLFADPKEREDMRHQLRTIGVVDNYEFTLCKADGSTIPAAITAKRVVYEGMDATVGVILDLTERRQAEAELARQREALHQSEKLSALGALLAGVAHELNNPLAIIVGRSIMLEQEVDDAEIVTAVGKIRQAAERCTRIVKTFLAMARQHQPECVPVNCNELITSTLELLDYGLCTASIKVHLDLAPDLPDLLADTAQLYQVVSNLFINAQQALLQVPEPRWLHVATHWDGATNSVNVEVIDNGPGVPQDLQSRIFDPFFTTKTVGAGTGVGLSLSHGIVTAHKGTLTLQDAPEGGARFVITLPLATAAQPQAAETPQAEKRVEPRSILIIEDEPDLAELFSRALKRVGHHTVVAHSGHEALATLAEHDYDVILSDLHMPDLNGPDFYRELQVSHPYLLERLAFITGDTLGEVARQFLSEANRPYLEKPIFPAEVRRLVTQLLE